MATLPKNRATAYPLSVASFALGAVGLLLFFMPVLGIPLGAIGLLFGVLGLLTAVFGGPSSLRWSMLGTLLCVLALAVGVATGYAPRVELPPRNQPQTARLPLVPYVSPPADPRMWVNTPENPPAEH